MTKEQKVEAYSMYLDGCTYQEIGDKFGISRQRVHQPDVCEEKGDDLKENLIEQVGNVHQGLAAILKFLS